MRIDEARREQPVDEARRGQPVDGGRRQPPVDDKRAHAQPPRDSPRRTLRTAVIWGLALGFVTWVVVTLFSGRVKHDLLPWLREPARVTVAAGWADKLPRPPDGGDCRPESANPPGRLLRRADSDVYEAPTRGEIELECEGRRLVLDVRRVAKVTVAAPAILKQGETAIVRMQAYDIGGAQLRVGDRGRVIWRVAGPLSTSGEGTAPSSAVIRGDTPGEGTVMADFDKLTALAKIRVE